MGKMTTCAKMASDAEMKKISQLYGCKIIRNQTSARVIVQAFNCGGQRLSSLKSAQCKELSLNYAMANGDL